VTERDFETIAIGNARRKGNPELSKQPAVKIDANLPVSARLESVEV
jgi:hypothetical protein